MESEMRISTICSRERAPKQLQFVCFFKAPHKQTWKSPKNQTLFDFLEKKLALAQQSLKKHIFRAFVLNFSDVFGDFCNVYVCLMLH